MMLNRAGPVRMNGSDLRLAFWDKSSTENWIAFYSRMNLVPELYTDTILISLRACHDRPAEFLMPYS